MSIRDEVDEAERAGIAALERVERLMGSSEKSRGDRSLQSDHLWGHSPALSRRPDSALRYPGSIDKKFRVSIRYWSGALSEVIVHPNMTIMSLKKLCCKGWCPYAAFSSLENNRYTEAPVINVLPHEIELSSNGRMLNDSWTLAG